MMENDPRTEPLKKWNELERQNAENAIVSSMFDAVMKGADPIEKFATWLLVGAAAVASFFLANGDKLIPLISKRGFAFCGMALCLSCIFGLISKMFSVACQIQIDAGAAVKATFKEHLEKYEEREKEIQEGAKFWGIDLQTGVRLERILGAFLKPMPFLVRWNVERKIAANRDNPQSHNLPQLLSFRRQGIFAILAAFSFLAFLCIGFYFAVTTSV